jgi:hypothetical protein
LLGDSSFPIGYANFGIQLKAMQKNIICHIGFFVFQI